MIAAFYWKQSISGALAYGSTNYMTWKICTVCQES